MTETNSNYTLFSRLTLAALTTLLAFGAFQLGTALPAPADAPTVKTRTDKTATSSRLSLNITGYDTDEGQMMVALYTNGDRFDEEATPFRDAKVRVTGPETSVIFKKLPVGEYAFKIFHDENSNGKLDTNLLGIPSEPYYFSTGASDPFSAPEWDESKFILPEGKMTRNLSLSGA